MKINFVQTSIAIMISLLIAYGFYSFHDSENKILLSVGSFLFLSTTLTLTIGTIFDQSRTTVNIQVLSGIFFTIALIINMIFAVTNFSIPSFIITNAILLLVFILLVFSIYKASKS
jgi:hypothetical protein